MDQDCNAEEGQQDRQEGQQDEEEGQQDEEKKQKADWQKTCIKEGNSQAVRKVRPTE